MKLFNVCANKLYLSTLGVQLQKCAVPFDQLCSEIPYSCSLTTLQITLETLETLYWLCVYNVDMVHAH